MINLKTILTLLKTQALTLKQNFSNFLKTLHLIRKESTKENSNNVKNNFKKVKRTKNTKTFMKFINWALKNNKEPTYKLHKFFKSNCKKTNFLSKITALKIKMTSLSSIKKITDSKVRKLWKEQKILWWKKKSILINLKIVP